MACGTLLVITVLTLFCLSGVSAGLVRKCKSDDSKCMKESAQAVISMFAKGISEYNVKRMDPISFKRIDASTPNLKLILSDITLTGLKDCIAKKIKRDKSKNTMYTKFLCSLKLESQYEMDGQLLIFPISGKGGLHATLPKLELTVEGALNEIEKGGVKYWDIKGWKHSFSLKDRSDVVFENLFNGNQILAQAARDVISSSGNEVIMEVGPTTIKTITEEIVNNINNFFHSVPIKELSLD